MTERKDYLYTIAPTAPQISDTDLGILSETYPNGTLEGRLLSRMVALESQLVDNALVMDQATAALHRLGQEVKSLRQDKVDLMEDLILARAEMGGVQ